MGHEGKALLHMLGLKHLGDEAILVLFTILSIAMLIFGILLNPAGSASVSISLVWIAGALILLGLFAASAVELAKRFLGGRGGDSGPDG
jgi:hypothetical protein